MRAFVECGGVESCDAAKFLGVGVLQPCVKVVVVSHKPRRYFLEQLVTFLTHLGSKDFAVHVMGIVE